MGPGFGGGLGSGIEEGMARRFGNLDGTNSAVCDQFQPQGDTALQSLLPGQQRIVRLRLVDKARCGRCRIRWRDCGGVEPQRLLRRLIEHAGDGNPCVF